MIGNSNQQPREYYKYIQILNHQRPRDQEEDHEEVKVIVNERSKVNNNKRVKVDDRGRVRDKVLIN